MCNRCCGRISETVTHFGRMSVALGIQHAMRMRCIVICGISGYIVLLRIISLTLRIWRGGEAIEYKMCALISLL